MTEEQLKILVEVNERCKTNSHRIDDLEEQYKLLHEMNTSIHLIAQQNETTKATVEEMKNDIEIMKNADGETFKNIKWLILSGALGYLLSYLLDFMK